MSWIDYLTERSQQISSHTLTHFATPQLSLTQSLVVIALFLLLFLVFKRFYDFQLFQRCGLQGPKPGFFLGNLRDIDDGNGTKNGLLSLNRKFGSTCGVFFGSWPHVLTSDPEVIKSVFVKDFPLFPNRQLGPLPPPKKYRNFLIGVHYERWRPIRSIMSPFFTAARLRKMVPKLQMSVDAFVDIMGEKLEDSGVLELDIIPMFQRMAIDAVSLAAFGLQVNSQREHHRVLDVALNLVEGVFVKNPMVFACLLFREVVPFFRLFVDWIKDPRVEPIYKCCTKLVATRKEEAVKDPETASRRDDLIKIMLDAEIEKVESDDVRGLTAHEIALQSQTLIVGGFETTSRTLSYICYHLSHNPEVQNRLLDELTSAASSPENNLTFDAVTSLELLNGVICETLRLCPPAPFGVSRVASRDVIVTTEEGKEFKIKKGVQVTMNVWSLHYDPEVWPEPEKFDPDRFSASASAARDPVSFVPFGFGHRSCIGMRFALTEIKMALASIVRRFEILPSDKGRLEPKMMDFGAKNVVWVKFKKR